MTTLDWQLRRTGEVTLVELSVHSEHAKQVRIESALRPVWPPRHRGVPVAGWDGHAYEGTVDAERPLVLGYATPAAPEEPPAEIVETGAPSETSTITPRDLVRTLGEAGPPRDALPTPEEGGTIGIDANTTSTDECEQTVHTTGAAVGNTTRDSESRENARLDSEPATRPEEPAAWFEAVESRLATAERLARATDADEARAAVDEVGGIESVRALQTQLDADRERVRQIRQRSETLSDRLSAVELPLGTLERVV